jgi:hypothetical protein
MTDEHEAQTGSDVSLLELEASSWRLSSESLTDGDLANIAAMAAEQLGHFGRVEAVQPGGARFAEALRRHATRGALVIVDDVLLTPDRLEAQREGRDALGAVIFAMGPCPEWVKPVFLLGKMTGRALEELEGLKRRLFYWAPTRAPDALSAIDAIGSERNQLLLSTEQAELKADLVDEAALLLRHWRMQMADEGALPPEVRFWLARYDSLQGHGGC